MILLQCWVNNIVITPPDVSGCHHGKPIFLLAEGALRGWTNSISAKEAYENGVRAKFEYLGLSQYVNQYLASTSYNRVGTSVNFDHTVEPVSFEADYVNGLYQASWKNDL